MLRQLARIATHICVPLLCFVPPSFAQEIATLPIEGGLGVRFGEPLPIQQRGAELTQAPQAKAENRLGLRPVELVYGQQQPWRVLLEPQLPRPFRKYNSATFVMLDQDDKAMRVVAEIETKGCGAEIGWLYDIITRKYAVERPAAKPEPSQTTARMRFIFVNKQIDVSCGDRLVIDYADYGAIKAWTKRQQKIATLDKRQRAAAEKKAFLLERRRAERFADEFTVGDRYRLEGGFGITFGEPFAPKSKQRFPVDQAFIVVLPNLTPTFASGELRLELGPARQPIVIRGQFEDLEFERIAAALRAKYGTPMKSTERHVIHKVSGNHAIVKRLGVNLIEIAFIDTDAKAEQRQRRWDKESEGL